MLVDEIAVVTASASKQAVDVYYATDGLSVPKTLSRWTEGPKRQREWSTREELSGMRKIAQVRDRVAFG